MDYPQEKNVRGREVRTIPPGFVVWGFIVQQPLPRLGVTWGMTEWLFWHTTLVSGCWHSCGLGGSWDDGACPQRKSWLRHGSPRVAHVAILSVWG